MSRSLDESFGHVPIASFEEKYRSERDPWQFATSPHEQRRYALTVAMLPARRFASAFEPGCSIGELTARLAPRCDHLLAIDASPTAVARARERCRGLDHVEVMVGELPQAWPTGVFDLVVLSELGYYFTAAHWARLVERAGAALADHGALLAVHWRGRVHRPCTPRRRGPRGRSRASASADGLPLVASYIEAAFAPISGTRPRRDGHHACRGGDSRPRRGKPDRALRGLGAPFPRRTFPCNADPAHRGRRRLLHRSDRRARPASDARRDGIVRRGSHGGIPERRPRPGGGRGRGLPEMADRPQSLGVAGQHRRRHDRAGRLDRRASSRHTNSDMSRWRASSTSTRFPTKLATRPSGSARRTCCRTMASIRMFTDATSVSGLTRISMPVVGRPWTWRKTTGSGMPCAPEAGPANRTGGSRSSRAGGVLAALPAGSRTRCPRWRRPRDRGEPPAVVARRAGRRARILADVPTRFRQIDRQGTGRVATAGRGKYLGAVHWLSARSPATICRWPGWWRRTSTRWRSAQKPAAPRSPRVPSRYGPRTGPGSRLEAVRRSRGVAVTGTKQFCSGSTVVDQALVTAHASDGRRLFMLPLNRAGVHVEAAGWATTAFASTATGTVQIAVDLPETVRRSGAPDFYLTRPGFWHGAVAVAACWAGGARGLVDRYLHVTRAMTPTALPIMERWPPNAGRMTAALSPSRARDRCGSLQPRRRCHGHEPWPRAMSLSAPASTCRTGLVGRAVLGRRHSMPGSSSRVSISHST